MDSPIDPIDLDAHWYCVHTKPKCEHIAAAHLGQLPSVEVYCPRIRYRKPTKRGKVTFVESLFPTYIFAKFDASVSHRAVKYTANVLSIVQFGKEFAAIPEGVIDELRQEIMEDTPIKELEIQPRAGDAIEVMEGPMKSMKGVITRIKDGEDRAMVLLEFLGNLNEVEMDTGLMQIQRDQREFLESQG